MNPNLKEVRLSKDVHFTGFREAGNIILDTTVANEKSYVEHVIDFVRNNNLAEAIYLFEAFDESEKPGLETERHFGVGAEDRSPKFNFDIASYGKNSCRE